MSQNFQWLPEWAGQQAVLLAWPHQDTDWRPWLADIEQDYVALASAIAGAATPLILCRGPAHQAHIAGLLTHCGPYRPRYVVADYNDTWCRDYGPLCLGDGPQRQLLDFRFTGWGDKYEAHLDDAINRQLEALWQAPLRSVPFELEGGSVDTDGAGTLLTTEHCLLHSNRNAGMQRWDIEELLRNTLGLTRILWLSEGALLGDDTDSHIDNLARFCDPGTIAYCHCDNPEDPHYAPLTAMEHQLQGFTRSDGSPYRLQPLPLPSPRFDQGGQRLPASYVNFLILNDRVIMPVFDSPEDALARERLSDCFPGKTIVTVPGGNLIRQFGGPHCATMQLAEGTLR